MARPFRFGFTTGDVDEPVGIAEQARRAEEWGYSTLSLTDHLDGRLGPLVGLTAAATATSSLRVGSMVLANDYRHPAGLAQELATLDVVSNGRLEIGIGAGWMTTDYEQTGIELDRPGIRIERLAEAITVLDRCFADEPFDFAGRHYTITGLDSRPKPRQRPRPPLLVAGGSPRILALAARRADIVGINPSLRAGVIDERAGRSATAEATDEKLAVVREAAGGRFDAIELQILVQMATITDDRHALAAALAGGFGLSTEEALASPHALTGTVEECVAALQGWRERWGISYVTFGSFGAAEEMVPVVERLAGA